MMKSKPDLKLLDILENINHYFNFLFDRGFHLVSIIFIDQVFENWQVTLMTEDCIIKVYLHEGRVDVALNTLYLYNRIGLFALDDLIYWVNGNEDLFDPWEEGPGNEAQSFERLAWRLEKHIDSILERIRSIPVLPSMDHHAITSNTFGQTFHQN